MSRVQNMEITSPHTKIRLCTFDPPHRSGRNLLPFLLLNSTLDPFSHPTNMLRLISLSYLAALYKFENSSYQGRLILLSLMPIPFALGLHQFVFAATHIPWYTSPLLCPSKFYHIRLYIFITVTSIFFYLVFFID